VIIKSSVSEQDLKQFYSSCKFVVHIALHEPFGLIPVEAALFSKPSVVSNVGGTNETVINGETGFVVNPYSPEETSKAMLALISNNYLNFMMGAKGRKKVAYFSIEKSTEDLVKSLMDASSATH
jgi:glycosyltransferase involved in cell wall biosynthesis